MHFLQFKHYSLLERLAKAVGGELPASEVTGGGKGRTVPPLARAGLVEWVRPSHGRSQTAIGLRITKAGHQAKTEYEKRYTP